VPENDSVCPSHTWRSGVRLSAAELRSIDVLPFLMDRVNHLGIAGDHRGQFLLALAELFTNALDHGLLELDSRLKAGAEGFTPYLQARAECLATLQSGFIEVEIEPFRQPDAECLRLCVKDSGRGFDYARVVQGNDTRGTNRAGRGISLVRALCSRVEYLGNGNEVVALYRLG
jgi:anti-sigma regulatory factor (Ser/Thr protein kinase)